jgi:hypothetical protein
MACYRRFGNRSGFRIAESAPLIYAVSCKNNFSDTLEAKSLKHLWIQIHKVILHSIAHFQHVSGVNIERIK